MSALLYASVTGAVLIAAVSLLRLFFGKQLSRSVFLVLWLLAVVRLLLPVSLPSPTSIYNLPVFRQDVILAPAEPEIRIPQQDLAVQLPAEESQSAPVVLPPVEEHPALSPRQWLTLAWAAVGLGIFLTVEVRHLLNRRRYRFSLPLPEDTEIPAGLRVRMLDGLSSPLTYGLFRPKVLLPVRCVRQPEQLRHILLHEQAHIRYGDLWKKHLFLLVACIHWFNPLVWLMLALAFEDMEIRCDAVAVGKLGPKHKKAYAMTLVSAETARLNDLLQSGFSHSTTARRLKALIHLRRRPVLSAAICIVLVVALSLSLMTGPVAFAADPVSDLPPETTHPTEQTETQPSEESTEPPTAPAESTEEATPLPSGQREEPQETTEPSTDPTEASETVPPAVAPAEVMVTARPQTSIGEWETTSAELKASAEGWFYTDRPDVLELTGSFYTNYTIGGPSPQEYATRGTVTITGIAPGTATVYVSVSGKSFVVGTVTVTARDIITFDSSELIIVPPMSESEP